MYMLSLSYGQLSGRSKRHHYVASDALLFTKPLTH